MPIDAIVSRTAIRQMSVVFQVWYVNYIGRFPAKYSPQFTQYDLIPANAHPKIR